MRESRFVQACMKISDLIILNVIFLVCCIPVITIGASITGLYYTTLKMVRDQETSPIYKNFFASFRQNFKQSTIVWLIMLVFGGFLYVDFRITTVMEGATARSLLFGFLIVMLIIYLCIWAYVFPMIARFENTTGNMIRNAMRMSAMKIQYTFPILVLNLSPLLVLFVDGELIKWFLAAYTFIWFAGAAYMNSKMLVALFEKINGGLE